jgi:aryl-alcohol dehydrogenase-like predicted oxidoreductase
MAVIGLGLAALGRPGYINLGHGQDLAGDTDVASLRDRAHTVLDAAYAGGVRYYDAARSYGRAEEFLGSWLTARGFAPRADLTVASKWGYTYTANWRVDAQVNEVKELTVQNLTRQIAESRALLGQYLGIYQIHSATIESGVLDDHAVLDELAQLRAGGLQIGFTSTGPHQAQTIRRALEVGGFDVVQATWNLLEPSAGPALAQAHAAGLRVVIKEAAGWRRPAGRRHGGRAGARRRARATLGRCRAERRDDGLDADEQSRRGRGQAERQRTGRAGITGDRARALLEPALRAALELSAGGAANYCSSSPDALRRR